MEPQLLTINRDVQLAENETAVPLKGSSGRHPGDGMESHTIDDHIRLSSVSYKSLKNHRSSIASVPKSIPIKSVIDSKTSFTISKTKLPDEVERRTEITPETFNDLLIKVDQLKTQLCFVESHNNQLIEEKMKLSQQLGVQTQVNNELKKLLVASIGEDLQQKYERLILDKSQADLELQHLHSVVEEDREEVEQAMIQADVWRSKFLASRVVSDELSRWKSALYYKYKESYQALENLLEEHSKIRALNNATKRGLTKMAEVLHCKDNSLDSQNHLTTIDVAFLNNDLVNSLLEIMHDANNKSGSLDVKIETGPLDIVTEKGNSSISSDILKHAEELTPAELLAHEVIVNTNIETAEVCRMRRDYLAHNRISHFLSTNYHVTFNCCELCKGQIKVL